MLHAGAEIFGPCVAFRNVFLLIFVPCLEERQKRGTYTVFREVLCVFACWVAVIFLLQRYTTLYFISIIYTLFVETENKYIYTFIHFDGNFVYLA